MGGRRVHRHGVGAAGQGGDSVGGWGRPVGHEVGTRAGPAVPARWRRRGYINVPGTGYSEAAQRNCLILSADRAPHALPAPGRRRRRAGRTACSRQSPRAEGGAPLCCPLAAGPAPHSTPPPTPPPPPPPARRCSRPGARRRWGADLRSLCVTAPPTPPPPSKGRAPVIAVAHPDPELAVPAAEQVPPGSKGRGLTSLRVPGPLVCGPGPAPLLACPSASCWASQLQRP